MAAPVIVRRATADELANLHAKERLPEECLAEAAIADQDAGHIVYAVALDGDKVLGTSILDLREGVLQPQLHNMWVFPTARRRGAGRALSKFLEDEARADFNEVFLAVDPHNEKVIPLHVSLGYSPTGDHLFVDDPKEF